MLTQQPDPPSRRTSVFTVTMHGDGADKVVYVSGELDLASAPRLTEALQRLSRTDTGELCVDTAGLTFCDCAGLSVLLAAARRRQAEGGRLVLTNAAPILRRVSHLLGLDTALGLTAATRPITSDAHTPNRPGRTPALASGSSTP